MDFHETPLGMHFFQLHVPRIANALERIAGALETNAHVGENALRSLARNTDTVVRLDEESGTWAILTPAGESTGTTLAAAVQTHPRPES